MEIIPDKIRKQLRAPMPPEAISDHPTKSFLSTIKAIYVTERLNDVFGIGGWTLNHEIVEDTPEYVTVKGCIVLREPYEFTTPMQYGGHTKTGKNTEPADGYKSAVTDMQSKCASYLEVGIDVFKGKVKSGKPAPKKSVEVHDFRKPKPKNDNAPSKAQYNKIYAIGLEKGLNRDEVRELAAWYRTGETMTVAEANTMIKKFDEVVENYMNSPEYAEKGDK